MPFVRRFNWDHDEEFGVDGWIPKHMPKFNALDSGFGMAHDVLEHFSDKDSSIQGEFLAFGSMLYLRAESDYWSNENSRVTDAAIIMAGDVARFLQDVYHEDGVPAAPKTRKLDSELEEILSSIAVLTVEDLADYFNGDDLDEARVQTMLTNALDWMRRGYRKAAKRFNMQPWERYTLFSMVERECERVMKQGDFNDVLEISVDIKRCRVQARIVEYRDPYAY